jgi:glycosyltransferase involved in cell wall biosynthesis
MTKSFPSLSITAVILTKNEEAMIVNCLETVAWCDDVLVADDSSTDSTIELAKKWGARCVTISSENFAQKRNTALQYIKTDWVFFIDADERVTPKLYAEISQAIQAERTGESPHAWQFLRQNVCYGFALNYGGWQHDVVARLFKRDSLTGWTGEIHESPQFVGAVGQFKTPLWHLTHRSTQLNLLKSAEWTPIEAKLLYEAGIPPVTLFTLLRKGFMEFWRRVIKQQGYKDGMAGYVEGVVQALNRVLIYIQVWELQQEPQLPQRYQQLETSIAQQWKQRQ